MRERLPDAYDELMATLDRLEAHYRDMQDIEFTVEEGTLYLLQTRTGKRTATAALRIAVEMVDEGLISTEEAVARIDPGPARPAAAPDDRPERAGRGRGPGAERLAGRRLRRDRARRRHGGAARQGGDDVILVRWETTPDDIHGLIQARGVLTAHGGMTSHAAVVARGMGKPCVAGLRGPLDRRDARTVTIGGHDARARAT